MRRRVRIRRRKEITRILRKGKRFECADFLLYYQENLSNENRVAVLVSRKLGGAVKRNRLKRVLRNMVWTGKRPAQKKGNDLIFRPCISSDFCAKRAKRSYEQWAKSSQI